MQCLSWGADQILGRFLERISSPWISSLVIAEMGRCPNHYEGQAKRLALAKVCLQFDDHPIDGEKVILFSYGGVRTIQSR